MNRFARILSILLLFVLAACGGDSDQPAGQSDAPSQAEATLPPPPATATLPPPVIGETGDPIVETQDEGSAVARWSADDFGYGIQVHGNATIGDPSITMEVVGNQLGMDWVKMQVQWWLVKPGPDDDQWFFYDAVIDQVNANGLYLMVSVVGAPEWTRAAGNENGPPDDFNLYADFIREMLNRYPGKIQAIEVWNEQNLDREWTTPHGISPEDYVNLLRIAFETIKSIDPNIIVISGALSPTGTGNWVNWADDLEYLDRALAAGMLNYADCVGAHHNGYNTGPNVAAEEAPLTVEATTAFFRGPFDDPHHSWSFKTTLDSYASKVKAFDPTKKLCVTEFGWASSEGYDVYPDGFGFAVDNTLQEQADNIVAAFHQMRDSGDVWLAFLFNFDFGNKGNGPADDPVPYSIIDTQGAPRPAFDALAAMEKPR